MDIPSSLAIVALAALIHASFQLSVSVLTLLSGHAIGAKKAKQRIFRLTTSYVIGAGVMTMLALSFIALLFIHIFGNDVPLLVWAIVCGLVLGIGVAVWLFYFRSGKGTSLWISRSFARHLSDRSKATHRSVESFSLGLTSVVSELIFILPSMAVTALVLVQLDGPWQLAGIGIYTLISLLGLLIVWAMVGGGHSISKIQKWRETNKRFLQFSAGSALIVLGIYVYVTKIVTDLAGIL